MRVLDTPSTPNTDYKDRYITKVSTLDTESLHGHATGTNLITERITVAF